MKLGEYNQLTIYRRTDNGVYLVDDENEEVLLPNRYVTDEMALGDTVITFVYRDSEDRLVATTETPKILLNQFAMLEAKSVTNVGAFMDWGLAKDLLVPYREQAKDIEVGKKYLVYLYLDDTSDRLAGSTLVSKHLAVDNEEITVTVGEEVHAVIFNELEIGYAVVVNNLHQGIIYKNELFRKVKYGDELVAYVRKVRPDGKLDISLQKIGHESIEPNADRILKYLSNHGGKLALTDKSSPDDIYDMLHMSKKLFKKAVGNLYKKRLIDIKKDGIILI